ncbi:MAG: hypothetical protein HYY06_20225 [Deltaproteobacteria bacterium]|nr:hypothetical protein [Deltaproteobacteria bacterium]
MWLFTTAGFFSIVQKPKERDLTVRSRVRADLERLRKQAMPELSETFADIGTDYRYRATIGHADFARGLARLGEGLRYPNFKSEVAKVLGARRAQTYSKVWAALWDLCAEDDEDLDRSRKRKKAAGPA